MLTKNCMKWIVLASVLALFLSCGGDGSVKQTANMGTPETSGFVKVKMKDFPLNGQTVEHVFITIKEVSIGNDLDGWTIVNNEQKAYDLLELINNVTAVLGKAKVPIGAYNQIRLILSDANRIVVNGQEYPLKIPSGEETGIKLNGPFEIKTCEILEIVLDFDAEKSIEYTDGQGYILKPVVQIASVTTIPPEKCFRDREIKTGVWNGQQVEYVSGLIPFKLKEGYTVDSIQNAIAPQCGQIQDFNKYNDNIGLVVFPDDNIDILSLRSSLENEQSIEWAEPDLVAYAAMYPNDFAFSFQWALENTGQSSGTPGADIKAVSAWNITTGGSVLVAVIDSGIPLWPSSGTLSHEDLSDSSKYILGYNYTNDGYGVMDIMGHGTHVAGIIGAMTNNGRGIAGVNWNVRILVMKILDGYGNTDNVAISYAINDSCIRGARVINLSIFGPYSSMVESAVSNALANDVVFVAATGNGNTSVGYPAALSPRYSNVIAVASTDNKDSRASSSNYGPEVTVAAPGVNIYSTTPNYYIVGYPGGYALNYDYKSGTSMAAPHVAGLASLLLSKYPDLTSDQVRDMITQTADDLGPSGFDNYYGWGRINANKALNATPPQSGGSGKQPGGCGGGGGGGCSTKRVNNTSGDNDTDDFREGVIRFMVITLAFLLIKKLLPKKQRSLGYMLTAVIVLTVLGCTNGDSNAFNPCRDLTDSSGGNVVDGLKIQLSTDKDVYASGQNVQLSLTVANISDRPKTLDFSSSQRYDFVACWDNSEKWKWSHDKAFAAVLGNVTLQPGETFLLGPDRVAKVTWNRTDNLGSTVGLGDFTVYGIFTAGPKYYSNKKSIRLE